MVNPKRLRRLNNKPETPGPIVYWMSRDQRADDNWALLYAQGQAILRKFPLIFVFCLVEDFLGATHRQYDFMLRGLRETELSLREKSIPFYLLYGDPSLQIPQFIQKIHAGILVTDFDPLRIKRFWKQKIVQNISIPFHEVDGHNIVPCWIASQKLEYGAYTIRPKIHRLLPEFLEPLPKLRKHPFEWKGVVPSIDWNKTDRLLKLNRAVGPIAKFESGSMAAKKRLGSFLCSSLMEYNIKRNDPNFKGQSDLSPYLHFGQISAQRIALEVQKAAVDPLQKESFIEELIVRRELADNFCFNQPDYDSITGFPSWAKATLDIHRRDLRSHMYTYADFDAGQTHDPLWNAAQMEMFKTGKMHGYLRMYWAKKILEWTEGPEEAIEIAIHLNDRYELDGRDPNGYTGIAWSIGGVHDRAWGERSVFGKIRYMSEKGCRTKFDVDGYITKIIKL